MALLLQLTNGVVVLTQLEQGGAVVPPRHCKLQLVWQVVSSAKHTTCNGPHVPQFVRHCDI